MVDTSPLGLLLALVDSLERASETALVHAKAIRALQDRDAELGDAIVELSARIDREVRPAGVIARMKAATNTSVCARCGDEFAHEPGPPLCGPCWVELDRPERYLIPVTLVPSPEGDTPA